MVFLQRGGFFWFVGLASKALITSDRRSGTNRGHSKAGEAANATSGAGAGAGAPPSQRWFQYGCFQKYGENSPNHPFNRVFHYKPSILGYPFLETPICFNCFNISI